MHTLTMNSTSKDRVDQLLLTHQHRDYDAALVTLELQQLTATERTYYLNLLNEFSIKAIPALVSALAECDKFPSDAEAIELSGKEGMLLHKQATAEYEQAKAEYEQAIAEYEQAKAEREQAIAEREIVLDAVRQAIAEAEEAIAEKYPAHAKIMLGKATDDSHELQLIDDRAKLASEKAHLALDKAHLALDKAKLASEKSHLALEQSSSDTARVLVETGANIRIATWEKAQATVELYNNLGDCYNTCMLSTEPIHGTTKPN